MDCRDIFDLHCHLKGKVKALKSTQAEIMVGQNTQANLVYRVWANVVHTAVNGVKSTGNGVKSLENGMKSPGNAVNTRDIPGHFSISIYLFLHFKFFLGTPFCGPQTF